MWPAKKQMVHDTQINTVKCTFAMLLNKVYKLCVNLNPDMLR